MKKPIVALTIALLACTRPAANPSSAGQRDGDGPVGEGVVSASSAKSHTPGTEPTTESVVRRARLDVERVDGAAAARVRRLLQPALEPLELCLPGAGGKLNLRVSNAGGALRIAVEPGPSVDPRARECALEALTTVYLAETASNVGGAGVPPSSFTSLVTLSW